jgi:glyoxylase-like metal-dependent hydrolase (beta-lactamase superfamily II)
MENLVTLTYRSTHNFLVDVASGKLMVDAGWPGSLAALKSQLRQYGIAPAEIKWVLITHMHPDHAGLAQEIKQLTGARLILHAKQIPLLPELADSLRGKGGYVPIVVEPKDIVLAGDSRKVLEGIGVRGDVIETPGHSDDSVSLVLDSGLAFIGDLHLPQFASDEASAALTRNSWRQLLDRGARKFYPAHGQPFDANVVVRALSEPT